MYKLSEEQVVKRETGSFQCVQSQDRSNAHELKHRSFHLSMSNHFFTVRVPEHRHMLPRKVVNSPYLLILKSCHMASRPEKVDEL